MRCRVISTDGRRRERAVETLEREGVEVVESSHASDTVLTRHNAPDPVELEVGTPATVRCSDRTVSAASADEEWGGRGQGTYRSPAGDVGFPRKN